MPHDLPQDWNVIASSGPLALVVLVVFYPLLFCFFRGLGANGRPPNVVGGIVVGVMTFVCCPLMCFSLVCLVSGLSFAWVELQMRRDSTLTDTGVVREKVIRTTFEGEGGAATAHRCLRIEFRDEEGHSRLVEREVDGRSWDQYAPEDRVPDIQYLRGTPETWRFAAESGLCWRLLARGAWSAALVIALRVLGGLLLRRTVLRPAIVYGGVSP